MIDLENIMAISGSSSLYKLVSNRPNGMILEDIATKKRNFYSARNTQFSPLESIGIYTLSDNIPLTEIYDRFLKNENEIPQANDADDVLKKFFEGQVPEYDRYRVYARDMKKCVKWFHFLKEHNLLVQKVESNNTEDKTESIPEAEN